MAYLHRASDRPRTFNAVCLLLVVAVMFGGASRYEVLAPLAVLVTALGVGAYLVWITPAGRLSLDRGAAALMVGMIMLPVIQLVPLPYWLWSSLPGRGYAVEVYRAIGQTPWLPVSVMPSRTWVAVLALIAPCVAFVATSQIEARGRRAIALAIVALSAFSALLAVVQIAAGPGSGFRFYAVTVQDAGVGLFANPNHQATFLAIGVLLALGWFAEQFPKRGPFPVGAMFTIVAVVALQSGGILLAGSRAGIAFLAIALVAGVANLPFDRITIAESRRRSVIGVAVAAILAIGGVGAWLATDPAVQALLAVDGRDGRIGNVPRFIQIMGQMFPFGSGIGTFDPVYRSYETLDKLTTNYLNQAHNEPAQLLIEGGLGAAVLIVGMLAWWATRALSLARAGWPTPEGFRLRRIAAVGVAIVLLHSTVDYPLRTAAIAVVFAVMCAMMLAPPETERARNRRN